MTSMLRPEGDPIKSSAPTASGGEGPDSGELSELTKAYNRIAQGKEHVVVHLTTCYLCARKMEVRGISSSWRVSEICPGCRDDHQLGPIEDTSGATFELERQLRETGLVLFEQKPEKIFSGARPYAWPKVIKTELGPAVFLCVAVVKGETMGTYRTPVGSSNFTARYAIENTCELDHWPLWIKAPDGVAFFTGRIFADMADYQEEGERTTWYFRATLKEALKMEIIKETP